MKTMVATSNANVANKCKAKAWCVLNGLKMPYDARIGCKYSLSSIAPDSLKKVAPLGHIQNAYFILQRRRRVNTRNVKFSGVLRKTNYFSNSCHFECTSLDLTSKTPHFHKSYSNKGHYGILPWITNLNNYCNSKSNLCIKVYPFQEIMLKVTKNKSLLRQKLAPTF